MTTWQPSANHSNLQQRAKILAKIRQFFSERDILEVDTPLLSSATVTDPHLHSFSTEYRAPGMPATTCYLQTSPEFAMKRLLAAGSGAIYQICKALRHEGHGAQHNPEFTLLEWYRPGFDHQQLMDEVAQLLGLVLETTKTSRSSYHTIFEKFLQINPHQASLTELQNCAAKQGIVIHADAESLDKDDWLQLLMTHSIEPKIGQDHPVFIYDFPESQAALAKLRQVSNSLRVAERFELYYKGIELANGFHELTDASEQERRFEADQIKRAQLNYPKVSMDKRLIAALEHGLPNCAGVALGIDRLIMLALDAQDINEVISFSWKLA